MLNCTVLLLLLVIWGLARGMQQGVCRELAVNGRKEGEWPGELTELSDHCELVVSPLV